MIDYWVLKLRITTLLNIYKNHKHEPVKRLTYIEITRPAAWLLKFLQKNKLAGVSLHKIKGRIRVSGPSLNISEVRNDNEEVIIMEIYHHILEIRLDILKKLTEDFKKTAFLKDQNPVSMSHSYIGLKIASDINPAVYMAHYARWKYKNDPEKSKNILVIPRSDWSADLVSHLGKILDRVVVDKQEAGKTKKMVSLMSYILKAFVFKNFTGGDMSDVVHRVKEAKKSTIMVTYKMGVLKDKRNDIAFFHASGIDPLQMLIFFKDDHHFPTPEELTFMKESGIRAIAGAEMNNPPISVSSWKPSPNWKIERAIFGQLYLQTLRECLAKRKKHSLWLLRTYWALGMEMTQWKDFFLVNNIRIIVNAIPAVDNFVPNIAITAVGGLAVELERSIRFDYCTYIHNSPNHVYFATGPYSLTQTPEPSFSLFTVQAGGINIIENTTPLEGAAELRRKAEKIITVFDEVPNEAFFGKSVEEMYRCLVDLVKEDSRFALLIKTKKPQVLEGMPEIHREILQLSQEGRCLAVDWRVNVSTAVAHADLVVCVPSTAAFESVMMKAPTIVYNPMRSGSRLFYRNNGLNRRIFEDKRLMMDAIKKYADGEFAAMGDCSDILPFLDPFDDGKGAKRMGDYLLNCLESLEAGLPWQAALEKANELYQQQYGSDKITYLNSYESLYKRN
ncbi:MAG: hypothetical protein MUF15_00835 [Acidobacteria bacterium]|jgi:hypothetical protein|nr:hypothetical protein [Acidobacteriota bacterium]